MGYVYLLLFRRHAVFMVRATAVLQVLLPLGMGVAAATVTNSMAAAAPFLFIAGMAAVAMYLWYGVAGGVCMRCSNTMSAPTVVQA